MVLSLPIQLRSDRVDLGVTWHPGGVSPPLASGTWWGGMVEGRGRPQRAVGMEVLPGCQGLVRRTCLTNSSPRG